MALLKICAACLLFLCTTKFFTFKDENFYEAVYKIDYLDAVLNESLRMYPPGWQYDHFIVAAFTVTSLLYALLKFMNNLILEMVSTFLDKLVPGRIGSSLVCRFLAFLL